MSENEACRLMELPENRDARGALSFAQIGDQIPFAVKRIFYMYDISEGQMRGDHAHREQHQFLIMFSGSCTVTVDTGGERRDFQLSKPNQALYAPPMHWLTLKDFSAASVCGVLASGTYQESDYVRDYDEFLNLVHSSNQKA